MHTISLSSNSLPAASSSDLAPSSDFGSESKASEPHIGTRASVVISVYENDKWIGQQLQSLFDQWRPDIDLIVIDDGSCDLSLKVALSAISSRPDVSAVILRNDKRSGLSVMKQVLELSNSQIIIQADSDDITLPGRIDTIIARFDADQNCKLVTSNAIRSSMEDIPISIEDLEHDDCILSDPFESFSKNFDVRWIGATSAFHRSLIEDFPFDAELCPYGLDLILAPRASLIGTHHYISEPLVAWRQHPKNTHRLAGALSKNDAIKDRYLYLELMAWAQRVRDIEHLLAIKNHKNIPDGILEFAKSHFVHKFSEWSRIHNKIISTKYTNSDEISDSGTIAIPPIFTLLQNTKRHFGKSDVLGVVASHWAGIWAPEADWNWTGRRAIMVLRTPGANAVRIQLSGLLFQDEQTVMLKAGNGAWKSAQVSGSPIWITLDIETSVDLVVLRIEAPAAARPSDYDYNLDDRRLGVCLHSIESLTSE